MTGGFQIAYDNLIYDHVKITCKDSLRTRLIFQSLMTATKALDMSYIHVYLLDVTMARYHLVGTDMLANVLIIFHYWLLYFVY